MENKNLLTKILAVAGTVLAWFPIAAPILLTAIRLPARGMLRFDYLMPAELFLFALAGGLLLLWAALRSHARRALIGWGLVGAVVLLVGGQVLAAVTGLASGETEPVGWPWALVLASLAGYIAALIAVGVGGALLLHDVFGRHPPRTLGSGSY